MNNFAAYFERSVEVYTSPFIKSALAVFAGYFIYILVCRALKKIAAKGFLDYQLRIILGGIVKWILIVVVILLCLGFFGVSVGTLWAALSGMLALIAVGFIAVWSVLSNILCSILLIIFPPFRIGDEIEIQEPTSNFFVRGKVVGTNMLFTSLEATPKTRLTPPSSAYLIIYFSRSTYAAFREKVPNHFRNLSHEARNRINNYFLWNARQGTGYPAVPIEQ